MVEVVGFDEGVYSGVVVYSGAVVYSDEGAYSCSKKKVTLAPATASSSLLWHYIGDVIYILLHCRTHLCTELVKLLLQGIGVLCLLCRGKLLLRYIGILLL